MSEDAQTLLQDDADLLAQYPELRPDAQLVWTAVVEVGDPMDLGDTPKGHRFLVPITGGRFYGGQTHSDLYGTILSGGADRQLLRRDGVKELEAIYEMRTSEGVVLSIRNRVTVDPSHTPDRYAMSVIEVEVPDGPYAWLGRRLIVGTLQSARPERPNVIVRAWMLDTQPSA